MIKIFLILAAVLSLTACNMPAPAPPTSTTGVHEAKAEVKVQASGYTTVQENVNRRLQEDNKPGAVKHLYVISAYSGDVILYSTVNGKVTSSGKRLTPYSVTSQGGEYNSGFNGIPVDIGGRERHTAEVLQDDGTYGSSVDYIYWWDVRGVYHQHYV